MNFVACLRSQRAALACIVFISSAVAVRPVSAQSTAEKIRQRLGEEYRLVQIVVGGNEVLLPDKPMITLKLVTETVMAGKASLNLYFAGFDLDDQNHIYWQKPGIASTLMAGPPELMQLEQTFFAAVASTKTVSVAGANLVLENAESVTRLTFRKTDFEAVLKPYMARRCSSGA